MKPELKIEDLTCECTICGKLTTMTGTKKCDGCWTLDMQLEMLIVKDKQKAKEYLEDALRRLDNVL